MIDEETGLYYMNARYYDPATARFVSEDPARDGDSWYMYCGGDPVNCTDPTGYAGSQISAGKRAPSGLIYSIQKSGLLSKYGVTIKGFNGETNIRPTTNAIRTYGFSRVDYSRFWKTNTAWSNEYKTEMKTGKAWLKWIENQYEAKAKRSGVWGTLGTLVSTAGKSIGNKYIEATGKIFTLIARYAPMPKKVRVLEKLLKHEKNPQKAVWYVESVIVKKNWRYYKQYSSNYPRI